MAMHNLAASGVKPGTQTYRIDLELQSVQFYANVLNDELLKPGRFKPYVSATIDREKVNRKSMNEDIRNVEFNAPAGGVTVPINERLEGLAWGPNDRELNVELWDDRTLIPDRLIGVASMPLNYLLQMAQGQAGVQQQQGLQPVAAMPGQGRLLLTQPFAFNLQPEGRFASKFNSLRTGSATGTGMAGTGGMMAGGGGMGIPPGIARVICTLRLFQTSGFEQQMAPMGAAAMAPVSFPQYEILAPGEMGPAGQTYMQQKLGTQAGGYGAGIQQPMQATYVQETTTTGGAYGSTGSLGASNLQPGSNLQTGSNLGGAYGTTGTNVPRTY